LIAESFQKLPHGMAALFYCRHRQTSFVAHEIGECNNLVVVRLCDLDVGLEAIHESKPPNRLANEPLSRQFWTGPNGWHGFARGPECSGVFDFLSADERVGPIAQSEATLNGYQKFGSEAQCALGHSLRSAVGYIATAFGCQRR
jgi:hypothetical protein